ncbi:MAG: hypothetical protein U5L96_03370 [Owenweeksia sp.]|nr:hypothetical protein [Owenweeksia sp.]
MPEDFKYLALIESGLTDVVSPAGRHRLLADIGGNWRRPWFGNNQ